MNKGTGTLLLLGAAHSLNHSLFLVLPPLLERITGDLGASFGTMGLITTGTFLIYGAGALVGGPLSDKLGSVKVARLSIGLGGLMTLLFMVGRDVYVFGLGMFLMASWASFYHPTANGLIAKAFTKNTGGAMGVHNAAGNFGQVFTPTAAFFLGVAFNWRVSFVFFGMLSILTAFMMSKIEVEDDVAESGVRASYRDFLRVPNLWIILLYNVLVGSLFRAIDLFFPSLLSVERGFTGDIAAFANSLILLFGVGGQLVCGRSADMYGSTRVLIVATAGMMVSLFLLLLFPTGAWGVGFFIFLYGVSMFGHQPVVTSLVSRVSPRELMGLAYGVMFFSAFGVGSLSTTIMGYVADSYSLTATFYANTALASALLLVSAVLYLRMKNL